MDKLDLKNLGLIFLKVDPSCLCIDICLSQTQICKIRTISAHPLVFPLYYNDCILHMVDSPLAVHLALNMWHVHITALDGCTQMDPWALQGEAEGQKPSCSLHLQGSLLPSQALALSACLYRSFSE